MNIFIDGILGESDNPLVRVSRELAHCLAQKKHEATCWNTTSLATFLAQEGVPCRLLISDPAEPTDRTIAGSVTTENWLEHAAGPTGYDEFHPDPTIIQRAWCETLGEVLVTAEAFVYLLAPAIRPLLKDYPNLCPLLLRNQAATSPCAFVVVAPFIPPALSELLAIAGLNPASDRWLRLYQVVSAQPSDVVDAVLHHLTAK